MLTLVTAIACGAHGRATPSKVPFYWKLPEETLFMEAFSTFTSGSSDLAGGVLGICATQSFLRARSRRVQLPELAGVLELTIDFNNLLQLITLLRVSFRKLKNKFLGGWREKLFFIYIVFWQ